ncbi:MAG TPA: hypothetical protein VG496_01060, partial [Myxococcales bacterium]|nr:hypothetical protein [Myxococcales bacterium]
TEARPTPPLPAAPALPAPSPPAPRSDNAPFPALPPKPPDVSIPRPTAPRRGGSPPPPESPYFDAKKLARDMARVQSESAGSSGMITGARVLERVGRREQAEKMLRSHLARFPADSRALLELVALLRRSGRNTDAELHSFAKLPPGMDWPAPILRAYAGQMSDRALLQAAKSSEDESEHLCEANYHLGLLHATGAKPDKALAATYYREAANGDCSEAELASDGLERLAGSQ